MSVLKSCVLFVAVLSMGTMANAYGSTPEATVTDREVRTDVQLTQLCLPKLSPQMAATFGLPLMQPQTQACPQG